MSVKNNRFYLNLEKVMGDRGEIFQTPRSEIFQFRSWIPDERRYYTKTLKTKDRRTALQRAEEEVLRINSSKKLGHSVFGATIKQLCHDWMEEQEKRVEWGLVKLSRIPTIKSRLNKWIHPYLSERYEKVNELTRQSMMDYPSWRRSQVSGEVKDVTISQECGLINNIVKYAFNKDLLPFEKLQLPKNEIKIDGHHRDYFTREEWKTFYRCFPAFVDESENERDRHYRQLIRDFVLIAANSCSRVGELRQVQWKMVEVRWVEKKMDDGSIQTRDTIEWSVPKRITKTNTSRKFVSRGGKYVERIATYYPHEISGNGFVFSQYEENKPLHPSTVIRWWNKLVAFSGIEETTNKHFVPYSLRHYGITNRLAHGVSPYLVAKMSGTSLNFIEKHYEHLQMDIMRHAALQEASLDSQFDYAVGGD